MELLCNAPAHATVPDRYVFPPEKRAAMQLDHGPTSSDVALPIIDLHGGDGDLLSQHRSQVTKEIIAAGKEFGFFQVVNHGVGDDVIQAYRDAAAVFFALPAEEKLPYCSYDMSKRFRLATNTSYDRGETRYWRDYVKFRCYQPSDDNVRSCLLTVPGANDLAKQLRQKSSGLRIPTRKRIGIEDFWNRLTNLGIMWNSSYKEYPAGGGTDRGGIGQREQGV